MPNVPVQVNSGPFARLVGEETVQSDTYKARRDQAVAAIAAWSQDQYDRDSQLRKDLASTRRIITRNLTTAENTIHNIDPATVETAFVPNTVISKLKIVENARDKLEVFVVNVLDLEPWNTTYYQNLIAGLRTEHDEKVRALTDFLAAVPAEAFPVEAGGQVPLPVQPQPGDDAQAPQMAGTAPQGVKANTALKPIVLTLDHSPVEMEEWIKAFEAYHSTSNMVKLRMSDQHAYFLQSLDPSITTLIRAEMTPGARLFGDRDDHGCLVAILRRIFLQRYPLFARREQFFSRQFHGDIRELPSFITTMHKERVAAEIDELGANDLLAYRLLSAINDRELRKWCAREETLTLDVFTRLAYQRVRETENLQKPSKTTSGYHTQSMLAIHDRCTYCSRPGHRVAECNTRKRDLDTQAAAARARKTQQRAKPSQSNKTKKPAQKYSGNKGKGNKGKGKGKPHTARQVEDQPADEAEAEDDDSEPEEEEEDVRFVSSGYVNSA